MLLPTRNKRKKDKTATSKREYFYQRAKENAFWFIPLGHSFVGFHFFLHSFFFTFFYSLVHFSSFVFQCPRHKKRQDTNEQENATQKKRMYKKRKKIHPMNQSPSVCGSRCLSPLVEPWV